MTTQAYSGLNLKIGQGALKAASARWRDYCVVTTKSPWSLASPSMPKPKTVIYAENLKRDTLRALASEGDTAELVVGVGSGLAMDTAKFIAKAKNAALVQVPSTCSNNACFTAFAWNFENGARVPNREVPSAQQIVVDVDLLNNAPARMNRAGAAEIFCSHTALFDWRCGREAGVDVQWDDEVESLTRHELAALEEYAPDIAKNKSEAFVRVMEVGAKFAPGFRSHPKARFNGGSEHILAWGLEAAGTRVIHGEAVSLGVLIMSHIQGNNPQWAAKIIKAAQIAYRPEEMNLTWNDVEKVVLNLPEAAKLVPWYTVINDFEKRGSAGAHDLETRFKSAKEFVLSLG